jgi:hypothetical protein
MLDGEKLFLNILLVILASGYWFTTGHIFPALTGFIVVLLYFFDETFAFVALVLTVLALFGMIYFFFVDYAYYKEGENFAQFGFSTMYMLVLYLKARSIFNAS